MNAPDELAALPQWVVWKLETRKGKTTKVPYRPKDGRKASSTDPNDWASFDEALDAVEGLGMDGVGFVFTPDDPYCGVDLDHCVDESGDIHPDAWKLVEQLGTYAEISVSGTGVHCIFRGHVEGRNRTPNTPWGGNLEVYSQGRYFTFTGRALNGLEIKEATFAIQASGQSDDSIINKCRRNSSSFSTLFDEGDFSEYVGDDGEPDRSRGDLALANMIAARTEDAEQIERIMRRSAMVREKWDHPDTGSTWLRRRCIEPAIRDSNKRDRPGALTGDFEQDVEARLYMLKVNDEARTRHLAETAQRRAIELPMDDWSLADELSLPPREHVWRVQDLQRVHGNVVLIAGYKLGKTTLTMNLIRSLVDGVPFLGVFEVMPLEGNVAVFNYELDPEQWVDWARDMRIENPQKIKPVHLRGLGAFQFWVPTVQDKLVEWMKRNEIEYWVLDPTAQAWSSLLESEGDNINADRFTKAIDRVKERADVSEANLTHHTSRDPSAQDKGRGPSALEGWYDAGWFLTGKRDALQFHAIGRDVDVGETPIAYHEDRRRTFLLDDRDKKEEVAERKEAKKVTLEILHELGPLSQSALGKELKARGQGISTNRLGKMLEHWAKSADNTLQFMDHLVHGRRQRTFYLSDEHEVDGPPPSEVENDG